MPNGARYEMPINVKTVCETTYKETKKIKARVKSSKPMLAYGACNPNDQQIEELTIHNPNSFSVRCVFHLITYNNHKHEKSNENQFFFDNHQPKSDQVMMADINPNQNFKLFIKFQPTSSYYSLNDLKFCQGLLRISSTNYEVRTHVQLIGFIGKSHLVVQNLVCLNETPISESKKQNLFNINEQYTVSVAEARAKYEFNLTLHNQSIYSKCFIVPLILNADYNKMINKNDSAFKLNLINDYLTLDTNEKFHFKLEYFGVKSDFNLVLLWIEYDLFLYFYQYINENRQNALAQSNTTNAGSKFNLDSFLLTKLFSSNADFNDINDTMCSLNTTQETNMSVLLKNSSKAYENSDLLLKHFKKSLKATLVRYEFKAQLPEPLFKNGGDNRGSIQRNPSKLTDNRKENVNSDEQRNSINFNRNENLLDFTLSKTADDLDCTKPGEVWSLSPTEIKICINESNIDKAICFVYLKNHLKNKPLSFDLTYRSSCLNIEPKNGKKSI